MSDNYLFSKIDWSSAERNQRALLEDEIAKLSKNQLLNTPIDELCTDFVEKYRVNIPILKKDEIQVESPREMQIDISQDPMRAVFDRSKPCFITGTEVKINVPFIGDADAFTIKPTIYSFSPHSGVIRDKTLVIFTSGVDLEAEQVSQEINNALDKIDDVLTTLRQKADSLNSQLDSIARRCITQRRDKLIADQKLVESLGFKLKERPDSPKTYVAPEVRRKIRPKLPDPNTPQEKIEIILAEADYEHILSVIDNMAKVMERSPSAFTTMDEESLRWHFLVQLNGHYEGQAMGETFNYEGKTDILIRSEGRNIFIAECKYWNGAKKLTETLNQILGYSAWRDTKVAVIIFNRNKNFTNVLETIKSTTNEHANCKQELDQPSESSFRFIFTHRDDLDRELTLTIVAFDVPIE